jgi:hypothetical protein
MALEPWRPIGWRPERTYTGRCAAQGHVRMVWVPCSWCWGQARTWVLGPGGYWALECPQCEGTGLQLREVPA